MKIKKILSDKYFVAKAYIAAIIICWPIMGIVNFAVDKILIRTGNMPSVTYDIRQTETVAMAEKEGIYYSTDGDPQIIVYFEKPIYVLCTKTGSGIFREKKGIFKFVGK